jgi:hypothetical protein
LATFLKCVKVIANAIIEKQVGLVEWGYLAGNSIAIIIVKKFIISMHATRVMIIIASEEKATGQRQY